jgi:hypothetical protein
MNPPGGVINPFEVLTVAQPPPEPEGSVDLLAIPGTTAPVPRAAPAAAPATAPAPAAPARFRPRPRAPLFAVPSYVINLGQDIKFNSDPYGLNLQGMLPEAEYSRAIDDLNGELKEARSTALDHTLLSGGVTLLPLIPWAIRRKKHKVLHKRLLKGFIQRFNYEHPELLMRWARKPTSQLTIERREVVRA